MWGRPFITEIKLFFVILRAFSSRFNGSCTIHSSRGAPWFLNAVVLFWKLGLLRFEPKAFGWETRTLPLCQAAPFVALNLKFQVEEWNQSQRYFWSFGSSWSEFGQSRHVGDRFQHPHGIWSPGYALPERAADIASYMAEPWMYQLTSMIRLELAKVMIWNKCDDRENYSWWNKPDFWIFPFSRCRDWKLATEREKICTTWSQCYETFTGLHLRVCKNKAIFQLTFNHKYCKINSAHSEKVK